MIGMKVTLRLRMSSHDAHYAGELVDGARMLALFGDLATELLIRLDGDEGLFRAYDSVEFLAPVFAGDYVEATAELVRIGETSRQMRFEARKVIANLRQPGAPASAAEVISEPVVVCRATGTCVTPKGMQRRPKELYMPALPPGPAPGESPLVTPPVTDFAEVILTAAIVGAEVTRGQTPHLPITAQEIADEAASTYATPTARRRSRRSASPKPSPPSGRRPIASCRRRPAARWACRSTSARSRSRVVRRWRR
jgi:3-keto-5-aminohexanoate cleavage enzyme